MKPPAPAAKERQNATRVLLRAAGILPVITVENTAQAVAIAAALARGGLTAIEVTLRSPAALPALGVLKREVPALSIGAGTVRTIEQAGAAQDQGADFLVTPGTPPALAAALAAMGLPVVPGTATPAEMMALMDLGFDAVKLFPASALGGLNMVKSLAGPFPDLALCPTGGIGEANALDYLRQPNVLCIGGSWMVAPDVIAAGRFDEVETRARRAGELLRAARANDANTSAADDRLP
jgi:2-dehydro-3-deoxyphosphogluconate aldolase/(4S)-4-hydroxy-2-oxoglutarate aldolase